MIERNISLIILKVIDFAKRFYFCSNIFLNTGRRYRQKNGFYREIKIIAIIKPSNRAELLIARLCIELRYF